MIRNLRKQKTIFPIRTRRKNHPKNEDCISSLWDNCKSSNISIIGVAEREEKEQEIFLFEKLMKENFPNWVKEIDIQVEEPKNPK